MAVAVMQRYEMKYLLDGKQTDFLRRQLDGRMQVDEYGLTSIASLYYDTPDARLIRSSLEKPAFKEKLRLRSYGLARQDSPVLLELKRKYDGVVYKRRVQSTIPRVGSAQIQKEIAYFRDYYETLSPACLILYDRTAYCAPGGGLRLTIDAKPRYRTEDLTLTKSMDGIPLLDGGRAILEIKAQGALPLWLSAAISEGNIFKSSFSKYGEAYRRELLKKKENAAGFAAPRLLGVA